MKALVLNTEACTAHVRDVPKPVPSDDQILIGIEAVALNPVDSLYVFNPLGTTGRVIGSDFAGTISEIGTDVPSSCGLKAGDRVAGSVQGACSINHRPGAFAEYITSPWDLAWKVPDSMSLYQAATINLCGVTAAQALYYRMGLSAPFNWTGNNPHRSFKDSTRPLYLFIYGATTSVGLYAAQLVQHMKEGSSLDIVLIGAASKKHHDTLRADPYLFDHLFDYRDDDWPAQVLTITNSNALEYAYDCISEGNTVERIHDIMRSEGKLAIVRSAKGGAWTTTKQLDIQPSYGAVWEGLGEDVQYQGMSLPANADARAFAKAFYKWLSETGGLQPNRVRLVPGGLDKIVDDGFRLLGSGSMGDRKGGLDEAEWMRPASAEKLVYRISDTS